MSNLYDVDKNLINNPAPCTQDGTGKCRYKNADVTEIDWFDTHPRIVEVPAVTHATVQPPYEDEIGKTWFYNSVTGEWDIPAPETADEVASSNSDVPQV